jgi:phosphomevalonate kinase
MSDYTGRPLVCVDFDGTIAKYDGWKGVDNFGEPIPGAREGLNWLRDKGFQICVWTTRGNKDKIWDWLEDNQMPFDYINDAPVFDHQNPGKPPAKYFIDDRAVRFEGSWLRVRRQIEELEEIEHTRNGAAYHNGIGKSAIGMQDSPDSKPAYHFADSSKMIKPENHFVDADKKVRCPSCLEPINPKPARDQVGVLSATCRDCKIEIRFGGDGHSVDATDMIPKFRGVCLSGKARSGKDLICKMLIDRLGGDWHREALADALKVTYFDLMMSENIIGRSIPEYQKVILIDEQKSFSPQIRDALISLGKRHRSEDKDYWIKRLPNKDHAIVTDCRFLNELQFFKDNGYLTVRLECTAETLIARGQPPINDPSETELDGRDDFDVVMANNAGLAVLEKAVDEIVTALRS